MPEGQRADYRLVLRDGAGLHVKDFGEHYEAHIDEFHPDVNMAEHWRKDAPSVFVAAGVALGAIVGRGVGTSKDSTLLGAALGGLFAAMLASSRDE
ncbi:MAG: hypothetical protein M3020_20675 [Myxococcota bacterium]|nr:hypothetical protein [Myxococcota bacterium]